MKFIITTVWQQNYDDVMSAYWHLLEDYNITKEENSMIITINSLEDLIKLQEDLNKKIIIKSLDDEKYKVIEIYDTYRE